jgi:23S rRNA (cytosine1962-C5)-methyltransferase
MATLWLRAGREHPVARGHPWVLSGSVDRTEGDPASGDVVAVRSASGEPLGFGDYDAGSQIRVRMHHRGGAAPADDAGWIDRRLERALAWRARIDSLRETDALRLVNAEGDFLPGLVVDRYARWLVLKPGTPAMRRRAPELAKRLAERVGARGAWLRGDRDQPGALLFGDLPDGPVAITERERGYLVDLRHGQKTGFYLDQRDARERVQRLAAGRRVLDLYAYTGGFSLAALRGGASAVTAVESSAAACALLARNAPAAECVQDQVERLLARDERSFDLLISDPPPFARRRRDAASGARAQRALLARMLERASADAHLLCFSCSHHLDPDRLRAAAAAAANDAGRSVRVLGELGASPDHPVAISHPEGAYLCGLWLQVNEA